MSCYTVFLVKDLPFKVIVWRWVSRQSVMPSSGISATMRLSTFCQFTWLANFLLTDSLCFWRRRWRSRHSRWTLLLWLWFVIRHIYFVFGGGGIVTLDGVSRWWVWVLLLGILFRWFGRWRSVNCWGHLSLKLLHVIACAYISAHRRIVIITSVHLVYKY